MSLLIAHIFQAQKTSFKELSKSPDFIPKFRGCHDSCELGILVSTQTLSFKLYNLSYWASRTTMFINWHMSSTSLQGGSMSKIRWLHNMYVSMSILGGILPRIKNLMVKPNTSLYNQELTLFFSFKDKYISHFGLYKGMNNITQYYGYYNT